MYPYQTRTREVGYEGTFGSAASEFKRMFVDNSTVHDIDLTCISSHHHQQIFKCSLCPANDDDDEFRLRGVVESHNMV